ncbi:Uncharacterized protein Fot_28831 [Forsythia ovata]|uniref:Uncharacterized protein n=1 Tax=Forsythia ovata TaxID=205694 RepID=A0ABD1TQ41_9LAMI
MASKALVKALNLKTEKYPPCYQVALVKRKREIQIMEKASDVIEEDDKYEELKVTLMASTESELKDEKLNNASFLKEYHVRSVRDENKMSKVRAKLTSNNTTMEDNDVY